MKEYAIFFLDYRILMQNANTYNSYLKTKYDKFGMYELLVAKNAPKTFEVYELLGAEKI